ncbi:MAG: hypothetical protein SOV73_02260 [Candidatus Faecivivens sp.]|nr:hypothetical protein [Candidatus Faecivivens sp.]
MEDIQTLFPSVPALHGEFVPELGIKSPEHLKKRAHKLNKIVPSLEEAIRRTGLRDGMIIDKLSRETQVQTSGQTAIEKLENCIDAQS